MCYVLWMGRGRVAKVLESNLERAVWAAHGQLARTYFRIQYCTPFCLKMAGGILRYPRLSISFFSFLGSSCDFCFPLSPRTPP